MFVTGDLLVFTLFFGTYLYYLGLQRALFLRDQADLSQVIGLMNTLVMLTSSWCVALAVRRRRECAGADARPLVLGAVVCGVIFLIDKGVEWARLIASGHTLLSGNFFMLFFMLTGIHAMHVLIGVGILLYLLTHVSGGLNRPQVGQSAMESCATFWHLVDLLWVVLFALFYLAR